MILHIGSFCVMDCAYCILQSYFHPPVLQYFVNDQDLRSELGSLFEQDCITRIGTGEFTDSLIWEHWTDAAAQLVAMFAHQDRAVLELKTKTTNVSKLFRQQHHQKTILAWSLNTETVIREQERGTASLRARLTAAAECQKRGYPLAFHFDPIIIYKGCEEEYRAVIQQLFDVVSPQDVVWISMGTFRFMPALKSIIQRRFPDSKIVYGEFISGMDGKMRYFKPLRIRMYQLMVKWITTLAPDVCLYLCMEDDDVWQRSFGFKPSDKGGLPSMLDHAAAELCHLKPAP
jgi:spore photoproduct lyase